MEVPGTAPFDVPVDGVASIDGPTVVRAPTARVIDRVRKGIRSGEYPPLRPLPSYRSIARECGVSLSSVLDAMKLLEEEGFVCRADRRGTFPRASTPALAAERPTALRCINFIWATGGLREGPLKHEYLQGYTDALHGRNIVSRFFSCDEPGVMVDKLSAGGVPLREQGCVMIQIFREPLHRWFREQGIPFVHQDFAARIDPDPAEYHGAFANKFKGGFEATQHLLGMGHRRIGYFGSPQQSATRHVTVVEGYQAALAYAGLRPATHGTPFHAAQSIAEARPFAEEFLRHEPRPTAVVCGNDIAAVALVQAAVALGVRVPEEMSVIGFNNDPEIELSPVPLTSVYNPRREVARLAVEMLMDMAASPGGPWQSRCCDCRLVPRASVAAVK